MQMTNAFAWTACISRIGPQSQLTTNGNVALRAARAGVCAARRARGTEATVKADATRVSAADYAAQAAIIQELPSDAYVIAEECSSAAPSCVLDAAAATLSVNRDQLCSLLDRQVANGAMWWVDPIDGTEGFLRGASWAVGVAMRDGPAALALPARRVILVADESLWVVNDDDIVHNIVRHNVRVVPHPIRWHFSPAGKEHPVDALPLPERLCCGSLVKYGEVALGASNALIQAVPMGTVPTWDHAAGVAAVLAAGGTVTDIDGNMLRFDNQVLHVPSRAFVATAPGVDHQQWLDFAGEALRLT